jgi:hypothetical protein
MRYLPFALAGLLTMPVPAFAQTARRAQPIAASDVPQKKKVAPLLPRGTYLPTRTPWGDPDIAGNSNNSDESGIPFERPDAFAGRRLQDVAPQELAKLVEDRQRQTIERAPTLSEFPGATSPMHGFENYNAVNSRAWLVSDPADGKVPQQTGEAQQRGAARTAARKGRGPADSWEDRSLYDRCITRGIPGWMMPAIYGDSRGHWEGDTQVVETTNFLERSVYRGANPDRLKITERFTPKGPRTLQWTVTIDDPTTWRRPWTFALPLTLNPSEPLQLYECHDGNCGLRNILSTARAEERAK